MEEKIRSAAQLIGNSKHTTVFTGAGISVESGIAPFRGEGGLWNKYDPALFEIGYFKANPGKSWKLLKEIFFEIFGKVEPNDAHKCIALLEEKGYVKAVITQNIDHLHQRAGSRRVYEFHGTSQRLVCTRCHRTVTPDQVSLEELPPLCETCKGILKPDFIFFGEGIPEDVRDNSFFQAHVADVFLVIGTTGEVMPACQIPLVAKQNGARIIEINTEPSTFTYGATDIFLQGKAAETMSLLTQGILGESK